MSDGASASGTTSSNVTLRSNDHTLAGDDAPGSSGIRRAGEPLPAGTVVGRFVVGSVLGAGGMGVVHQALDPQLDRKVALKLLRGSGATSAARMLAEARALAALSHPNVVAIYDVGTLGDDVWIAMALVEGITLGAWLHEHERGWREVVDVMLAVAEGLAGAHAAGIVHRDLKPENVMVSESDGQRRVLVMDFGLATAAVDASEGVSSDRQPEVASERTIAGVRGTPGYMPPEQHRSDTGDPRMDQFAYCVTFWEALYRERPFAGDTWGELVFAISHGRLRSPPAGVHVPRWLRRILERGLATDPARRWPSMAALVAAVRRGQANARWRWLAATLAGATTVGLGAIAWQRLERASAARACADEAARIAEVWPGPDGTADERVRTAFAAAAPSLAEEAVSRVVPAFDAWTAKWREVAEAECTAAIGPHDARHHEAVLGCLAERRVGFEAVVTSFAGADALVVRRAASVAASLTDAAVCHDDAKLFARPALPESLDPATALELRLGLERARSLRSTGRIAAAAELAESTVASARAYGWMPLVAEARLELGRCRERSGDLEGSAAELEAAYLEGLAHGHDDVAVDAATMLVRVVGVSLDRVDEGRRWGERARALLERTGQHESLRVSSVEMNLGMIARATGARDEARTRFAHAAAIRERLLDPEDPDLAAAIGNVGNTEIETGDVHRAIQSYERVLAIFEATLGTAHPDTMMSMMNIGTAYMALEDATTAEGYMRRALALQERSLGDAHPDVALTLHNLAESVAVRGDYDEAAALAARALEIGERVFGSDHPDVSVYVAELGEMRMRTGKHDAAAQLYARASAILERTREPDHPAMGRLLLRIGDLARARGDHEAARGATARAVEIFEHAFGPQSTAAAAARRQLGVVELSDGRHEPAMRLCREAKRALEAVGAAGTRDFLLVELCLAEAELAGDSSAAAIAEMQRVLTRADERRLTEHLTASPRFALARATWSTDPDGARQLARRAAAGLTPAFPHAAAAIEAWLATR